MLISIEEQCKRMKISIYFSIADFKSLHLQGEELQSATESSEKLTCLDKNLNEDASFNLNFNIT